MRNGPFFGERASQNVITNENAWQEIGVVLGASVGNVKKNMESPRFPMEGKTQTCQELDSLVSDQPLFLLIFAKLAIMINTALAITTSSSLSV